ncbi:hypothetical protein ACIP2X_32080 [Streptomyces sp. NPDC089424]|uniref:hypothetical protein n=1 Tax=Streptomyces sp. NPDC089424 TaxID=3365917 RepID=UPI0037FCCF7A
MPLNRPTYVELGYSGDFGLTGLTERLCSPGGPAAGTTVDLPAALAVAARSADESDGEEAVELGEDARRLLDGQVPDDVLHMVWLAAVGRIFDPADHGMDVRTWLETVSDLATDRLRRNKASYVPPPVQPVRSEDLCGDVVAEIQDPSAGLTGATGLRDLVPSLVRVAGRTDADLGFRLFLRTLKANSVQVSKERYDRFLRLGEWLGFPVGTVRDGLDVDWPPIDTTHRGTSWDFGLSRLAGNAHQDWRADRARSEIRCVSDTDEPLQSPGSAADLFLEDALRLLHSPLSDDTITTLWLAVSDAALRVDGRDWLRLIAEVCGERLRDVAPTYTPVVPPTSAEPADTVLRELREVTPALAEEVISAHWQPVPAAQALSALEQVVSHVDPDLGFRLFLRLLRVLSASVTRGQYERYQSIGERFGFGEYHVDEVEHLVW